MRRKLQRKGADGQILEDVLAQLRAERLQSDERFAEAFVRSRRERGLGPARIRAELRERGVSDELVERCLGEPGDDWRTRLEQVRRKRFGPALPADYQEWARQARFLQYRGFTPEQIRAVLQAQDE